MSAAFTPATFSFGMGEIITTFGAEIPLYVLDFKSFKNLIKRISKSFLPLSPAKDSLNPKAAMIRLDSNEVRCCSISAKLAGLGWRSISSADQERFRRIISCLG